MKSFRVQNAMRHALAALAVVAVSAGAVAGNAGSGTPVSDASVRPAAENLTLAGPPYEFTTALIDGRQVGDPLTGVAVIDRTELGYVYRAGSQNNHLVVTRVSGGLRFADTGTPKFKSLASDCRKVRAVKGVAAVCRVPAGITTELPLLVEVWPRIGDDYLDTTGLSAQFSVTMLGDLGNDVAHFGPGSDFFNGHTGRDRVTAGAGNDWVRTGDDDDVIYGGPGDDYLVGMMGNDVIWGEDGDDRLVGMDGNDRLFPGVGLDLAMCGGGSDDATVDNEDFTRDCELVTAE